jgi:primosomal protein N'
MDIKLDYRYKCDRCGEKLKEKDKAELFYNKRTYYYFVYCDGCYKIVKESKD